MSICAYTFPLGSFVRGAPEMGYETYQGFVRGHRDETLLICCEGGLLENHVELPAECAERAERCYRCRKTVALERDDHDGGSTWSLPSGTEWFYDDDFDPGEAPNLDIETRAHAFCSIPCRDAAEADLTGNALSRAKSRLILQAIGFRKAGHPCRAIASRAVKLEEKTIEALRATGEDETVNRVSLAGLLESVDPAAAIGAYQETIVYHLETTKPGSGRRRKLKLVEWITERVDMLKGLPS